MKNHVPIQKALIAEIFYSFQGEGLNVGEPQVFVRFAGCNLRCGYCDTARTQKASSGTPMSVEQMMHAIKKLAGKRTKTVSLTGGEPLLHSSVLLQLLPALKKAKFTTYLETNGTLPHIVQKVIQFVDVVSMDIKLPSATGRDLWGRHADFLRVAGKKAFVKVVLTGETTDREIQKTTTLIASISPDIPLVFQPVTPRKKCPPVQPHKLHEWSVQARKKLAFVCVLPQMHPLWGVR